MRIVMIFAGVLAVSVAAGSFLYMTQTGPEEISLEVASKPGARADKARVFGGRAKVTSPSPIGDNITGARSHSGAGRAGVTHAKQPEGIGMGTRRAAQSGGTSFNEISAGTGAANYAPGELLVANPPANFENLVVSQGFEVGGMLQLRSLDMKVLRLVTPANVSVTSAVQRLRQQFPGATTDAAGDAGECIGHQCRAAAAPAISRGHYRRKYALRTKPGRGFPRELCPDVDWLAGSPEELWCWCPPRHD